MEQQIAPTLWLPPGVCLLNPVPTMQLQPTSQHMTAHQMTSQLLKQQLITHTVPTTNLLQSQHFLQSGHILQQPAQNIFHIPGISFDNLLLPPSGKQAFEIQPPTAPLLELPCNPLSLQLEKPLPLQTNTGVLTPTSELAFRRQILTTKVTKKKRISPSAKRRSRLRLIAFLESKRKQQLSGEQNSSDESVLHNTTDDDVIHYSDDATSSSDDPRMSPLSQASADERRF